jgi:hypothetical protein
MCNWDKSYCVKINCDKIRLLVVIEVRLNDSWKQNYLVKVKILLKKKKEKLKAIYQFTTLGIHGILFVQGGFHGFLKNLTNQGCKP